MSNKQTKNSNGKKSGAKAPAKKTLSKEALISIICAVVILVAAAVTIVACSLSKKDGGTEPFVGIYADNDATVGTGACDHLETREDDHHDLRYVKMRVKGHGSIILVLDATTAPRTVINFMELVNDGFYDGLTFHRILDGFMIQGGDPDANGTGGRVDEDGKEINIVGEFSENGYLNDISHIKGVISMARGSENNSASSQFFICNADARESLDGKYAAFGYVIAGLDVVDSITEDGMQYTSADLDGAIASKDDQPVIISVVEITKEEAMGYVK